MKKKIELTFLIFQSLMIPQLWLFWPYGWLVCCNRKLNLQIIILIYPIENGVWMWSLFSLKGYASHSWYFISSNALIQLQHHLDKWEHSPTYWYTILRSNPINGFAILEKSDDFKKTKSLEAMIQPQPTKYLITNSKLISNNLCYFIALKSNVLL